jgi:thiamine-phosphate pyrophosphorylase
VILPAPPLLVISDRTQARRPISGIAAAAFAAGCRWFSLREKGLAAAERRALLAELVALGRRHGALVGVHDDIEAAIAAGAGAVHLQSRADLRAARARLPQALIGVSAHSASEAASLIAAGADYVTISPVFPTDSKPGYGPALGIDGLAVACASASGPVIALAGIDAVNAASCIKAGAAGVAVMGEIMRAADPGATVRKLVEALVAAQPRKFTTETVRQ